MNSPFPEGGWGILVVTLSLSKDYIFYLELALLFHSQNSLVIILFGTSCFLDILNQSLLSTQSGHPPS